MDDGRGEGPVATVAGEPIGLGDLRTRVDELRRGPRGRHFPPDAAIAPDQLRWIVRELVTEAVLVHEAGTAGESIDELVARVTAGVRVDEAEVRGYYDRNADLYTGGAVPYEQVRGDIEAELLVDARRRVFDSWLERRRRAIAVVAPAFEHPGHPIHGQPSHRH